MSLNRAMELDGHTTVNTAPVDEQIPALRALYARFIELP